MAYSVSRDLLFVGQGCHCCSNDILVYNGQDQYLYHFRSPVGPEDMAARDGLLYLADYFHALIHVFTYEGKWLRSLDVLLKNRIQGVIDPAIDMFQQQWNTDGLLHVEDEDQVASLCVIGEDKLAVGLEKGLIRILDKEGNHLFDIQPPAPGFYPKSMVADSSENLFVYYTGDRYFNKPRGLYRYGADGKVKGPLFGGELGIFKPSQKALEKKIAEDRADAYDYFNLADILIRRKKPLRETIGLLEKSLELKPDLWIALAYLGLSLKELGEIETAVNCMERAMEHMGCSNMATALMEYYYRKHDKEKVWQYFQRMEALEYDVDVEFYSEELTNEQIEQMLGALVKRNKGNYLVSN
jgi:tetratricopeptide (TPR) repeat protein